MMKVRYLSDTTKLSDQKISDSTPSTLDAVGREAVLRREALLERVERAGADVAVDHAQRPERGGGKGAAAGAVPCAGASGATAAPESGTVVMS